MKKTIATLALLAFAIFAAAQSKQQRFSPDKFRADMEQFIAKEACLTPQESAKFFPVYDEMNKKQRAIFSRKRRLSKVKPADDKGCKELIENLDKLDVELKQVQQTYHTKFMAIIPPSKLFDVIKAEEKFHRRMLRNFNHRPKPQGKPQSKPQRK